MKRIVFGTLFITWAFTIALLVAGLVFRDASVASQETLTTPPAKNPALLSSSPTAPVTLSKTEIKKHNGSNDCWLMVNGGVYNVSNYLRFHPGGRFVIAPFCGKDATIAFNTRGGNSRHSPRATALLSLYMIGEVGGKTTDALIAKTAQQEPGM